MSSCAIEVENEIEEKDIKSWVSSTERWWSIENSIKWLNGRPMV